MESTLDEIADPTPVQNPGEDVLYRHVTLEDTRSHGQEHGEDGPDGNHRVQDSSQKETNRASEVMTQLYTISYLILFAILGTLSRLGLQAITNYPGAPVVFSSLWPNFAGSLFMGFLSEERMLFKEEQVTQAPHLQGEESKLSVQDEGNGCGNSSKLIDTAGAKKAHLAMKKTIPLYVGLATGFCGSFTSFSSFIRDSFLALSNNLPTNQDPPVSRNGGYSFMAVIAVIIITVTSSISALHMGAHLAIFLEPYTPSLPLILTRRRFDRVAFAVAWGCWIGALLLAIWPPDRNSGSPEVWRGRAVFAIVFAPLGCFCRFYASIHLNRKLPSFPLGTFVVNIFGTVVLGMCWDLQHVPVGQVIGCQLLQGIEDGFCGCLTTVSTWVSELTALRRGHAYRYGTASVVTGLCFLLVIMGGLRWTRGFSDQLCVH